MKTTFCMVTLVASLGVAHAQDAGCVSDAGACQPAVVYAAPVVYQAPVVYEAPVVYQSTVSYAPSGAAGACYSDARPYSGASTVAHITGRGTYVVSNRGNYCGSSVIYIGSRQPRAPRYYRR